MQNFWAIFVQLSMAHVIAEIRSDNFVVELIAFVTLKFQHAIAFRDAVQ